MDLLSRPHEVFGALIRRADAAAVSVAAHNADVALRSRAAERDGWAADALAADLSLDGGLRDRAAG